MLIVDVPVVVFFLFKRIKENDMRLLYLKKKRQTMNKEKITNEIVHYGTKSRCLSKTVYYGLYRQ